MNGLVKKKITPDQEKKKKKALLEETTVNENRDPELWGKLNINNIPQFKQIGSDSIMVEKDVQVCIYLKEFHVNYSSIFKLPESVFCTIEFVNFFFNFLEWKNF